MADNLATDAADVRAAVVDRYSGYARLAVEGGTPIDCDADAFDEGCFGTAAYVDADAPDAALTASLGCGNPLAVADLRPGEVVLDLGSGGGLDVLLSARRVEPDGKVYGLDASREMIRLAQGNAEQAGTSNVQFLHGYIEDIPLPDSEVDVIISNCVINLSLDKSRVLAEAFRVLRPAGRLGISDVIAEDGLDPEDRSSAEQRVGCTAGTLTASEYEALLQSVGFTTARITATGDTGGGLHSAIIQAVKPATEHSWWSRRGEGGSRGLGPARRRAPRAPVYRPRIITARG